MTAYRLRDITPADATPARYGRRRRHDKVLKSYDVIVGDVVVGSVTQRLETFESRSPGKMYVNYRWQSPRWFAEALGENARYRGGAESRKRAVEGLLFHLDRKEHTVD